MTSASAIQKKPVTSSNVGMTSHNHKSKDLSIKDLGFKIFLVVVIALAAVAVIVGILALLVSRGVFPPTMTSIAKLSVIGEVNSYVMLSGGLVLFVLGILGWSCHLIKESKI